MSSWARVGPLGGFGNCGWSRLLLVLRLIWLRACCFLGSSGRGWNIVAGFFESHWFASAHASEDSTRSLRIMDCWRGSFRLIARLRTGSETIQRPDLPARAPRSEDSLDYNNPQNQCQTWCRLFWALTAREVWHLGAISSQSHRWLSLALAEAADGGCFSL